MKSFRPALATILAATILATSTPTSGILIDVPMETAIRMHDPSYRRAQSQRPRGVSVSILAHNLSPLYNPKPEEPALPEQTSRVVPNGGSLWTVAQDLYGDGYRADMTPKQGITSIHHDLYQQNREAIGDDRHDVKPGLDLSFSL